MIAAQSDQTGAVRQQDQVCRVSAHSTGTEVAQLIPEHESTWFIANGMSEYNNNHMLDAEHLLRDPSNAILLRADLHKAFDDRMFVPFPKGDQGFVVHVLQPAGDLRLLYYNTRVTIPHCDVNFVFARFAWSIFPCLSGFLVSSRKPRLFVGWDEESHDWLETEVSTYWLAQRLAASPSNSPTEGSRMGSSVDDHVDDFNGHTEHLDDSIRGRKRNINEGPSDDDATRPMKGRRLFSSKASLPSTMLGESTAPSVTECLTDRECIQAKLDPKGSSDFLAWHHQSRNPQQSIETDTPECGTDFNRLHREALIRQRPPGYYLPPYDKRRDAREELELMGMEIIDDMVTNEDDD